MVENILGWLVLVILGILFGWLTVRAWHMRNRILKWAGTLLGGLFTLVLFLVNVIVVVGMVKFYAPQDIPVQDLSVPLTPENIERGEHLANTFCASCHSVNGDLPMTGGLDLAKDLAIPLGSFVSVNLTPAGPLKDWTDGEIFNAIRFGVDREGRILVSMSQVRARNMSDADIHAIIAYLRSQAPVENETPYPPDQVNLLALILNGANLLPKGPPNVTGVITAPPKGATVAYGEYIISFQDCRVCHGEDLKGGVEGQLAPIGWNLDVVKKWTLEQFIATFRTGVDPNGYELSANMPWRSTGRMDDIELEAMYLYLVSLD